MPVIRLPRIKRNLVLAGRSAQAGQIDLAAGTMRPGGSISPIAASPVTADG
jgi:hypothetical protein